MANPSHRSLAELMRYVRRQHVFLIVLAAFFIAWEVAAGIAIGANPELPFLRGFTFSFSGVLLVLLIVIGFGIHALVTGRFRERATELLVTHVDTEPAFVVPFAINRWSVVPGGVIGWAIAQIGLPARSMFAFHDRAVPWDVLVVFLAVIAFSLGALAVSRRRGNLRLVMTSSGLRVPTAFGSRALAWTALAPSGPLRPHTNREGIWIRFHRHPYEMRFFSQLVHQGFVADVIRHYVEHPEHRAEIGTAAEHDRLLSALGVPAVSSAGVTVD